MRESCFFGADFKLVALAVDVVFAVLLLCLLLLLLLPHFMFLVSEYYQPCLVRRRLQLLVAGCFCWDLANAAKAAKTPIAI